MNPTRKDEVAGSIPGLAQWVQDLALPCRLQTQLGTHVAVAVGGGQQLQLRFMTPSLGTSMCRGRSPENDKRRKKKKKKKKKNRISGALIMKSSLKDTQIC